MTPEQMRALADAPDVNHWSAAARTALRAAADQLEAVQSFQDDVNTIADWLDSEGYGALVQTDELARLLIRRYPIIGLTADTAPQEDRDE